jgi:DNA-binding transcriptional MerR regulator
MNPISRRGQIFLALAAAEHDISLEGKQNRTLRLREAKKMLQLFNRQLESSELDEETREAMQEKKEALEQKIKEKKKDL